jgi:hypothetical protein
MPSPRHGQGEGNGGGSDSPDGGRFHPESRRVTEDEPDPRRLRLPFGRGRVARFKNRTEKILFPLGKRDLANGNALRVDPAGAVKMTKEGGERFPLETRDGQGGGPLALLGSFQGEGTKASLRSLPESNERGKVNGQDAGRGAHGLVSIGLVWSITGRAPAGGSVNSG